MDEIMDDTSMTWSVSPHCVGKAAPDHMYTSHRTYRRLRTGEELMTYHQEIMDIIDAGPREHSGPEYMKFLHDTSAQIARTMFEAGLVDIPDTPEQRQLIAAHNADIKLWYPNLIDITNEGLTT